MQTMELTSIDGTKLETVIHQAIGPNRGTILYAHGITADLDEFGFARRLAERLAGNGYTALRFSFRGHGRSGGTQRGATIAGEMLDLEAAVEYALAHLPGPISVVASSFGAVSTLLSLPWLDRRLHRLVLLRPVLDLRRTFIEPETPWGREHYSAERVDLLSGQGFLPVNDGFQLGRALYTELQRHDPQAAFLSSTVPALIVQGDADTIVPPGIAHRVAQSRPHCRLHTVAGADHGFDQPAHEADVITAVVGWLTSDQPVESQPTGRAGPRISRPSSS